METGSDSRQKVIQRNVSREEKYFKAFQIQPGKKQLTTASTADTAEKHDLMQVRPITQRVIPTRRRELNVFAVPPWFELWVLRSPVCRSKYLNDVIKFRESPPA